MIADAGPAAVPWELAAVCDLCGCADFRTEFVIHTRRYVRCAQCGVVRLMDRVAENSVGVLYDSYCPAALPAGAALERDLADPTFSSRRRHIESAIGSLPKRIFDVGCGDGNFLLTMKRAGWVVGGSEHGTTAEMTAGRHGIPVTNADVLHASPPGAPFPVVAAYHVLEHIYHPAAWVRALRGMIVPGGILR